MLINKSTLINKFIMSYLNNYLFLYSSILLQISAFMTSFLKKLLLFKNSWRTTTDFRLVNSFDNFNNNYLNLTMKCIEKISQV